MHNRLQEAHSREGHTNVDLVDTHMMDNVAYSTCKLHTLADLVLGAIEWVLFQIRMLKSYKKSIGLKMHTTHTQLNEIFKKS